MSYELSACRAEAMRICHERDIRDPDQCAHVEAAVRHQAFMRAIEPFQKEIAKLYGYRFLKRIILGDSENTTEYEWVRPEVPKMIEQWQEMIQIEAKKYGFDRPSDRVTAVDNASVQKPDR